MAGLTTYAPYLAVLGLIVAFLIYQYIKKQPNGNETMQDLEDMVHRGAMAFLRKEYTILSVFIVIVFILLGLGVNWMTAIAFLTGAICSIIAGYSGMTAATRGNSRTADAADKHGQAKAPQRVLLLRLGHGTLRGLPGSFGSGHLVRRGGRQPGDGQDHQRIRHGRLLHRPVRQDGRRYLHQGGRRGRRPGGQGRGRHPRGRPPQPRHHRRQRGRQRGRHRRHGRGHLRVLRGLDHRHHRHRGDHDPKRRERAAADGLHGHAYSGGHDGAVLLLCGRLLHQGL